MPGNATEDSSANLMDDATFAGLLASVRSRRPLVHHITNSVTINDCANITISAPGQPR